MDNCCTLYFLSTLSCQLADCMTENELAVLAADLATLGCMLSTILAHRALCEPRESAELPVSYPASGTASSAASASASSASSTSSPSSTPSSGTERQITIV